MKKIILKATFATIFVLIATFTAYTSLKSEVALSDLTIENIEALAQDKEVPATCTFTKVYKDQEKNRLECSGQGGSLCCAMN